MKVRNFFGLCIIFSPFVAAFIYGAITIGVLPTMGLYGSIVLLILFLQFGISLLDNDNKKP